MSYVNKVGSGKSPFLFSLYSCKSMLEVFIFIYIYIYIYIYSSSAEEDKSLKM